MQLPHDADLTRFDVPLFGVACRCVVGTGEEDVGCQTSAAGWIPLFLLLVIGSGGFSVSRLHGLFWSDKSPSYADLQIEDTEPSNPAQVIHEVVGSAGTVAAISHFDVDTAPGQITQCRVKGA